MNRFTFLFLISLFFIGVTLVLQPAITYKDVYSVENKNNCLVEVQTKTTIKNGGFLRDVSSPYRVYMFPVGSETFTVSKKSIMNFWDLDQKLIYSSPIEKSGEGVFATVQSLPKSSIRVNLEGDTGLVCRVELSHTLKKYFSFRRFEG